MRYISMTIKMHQSCWYFSLITEKQSNLSDCLTTMRKLQLGPRAFASLSLHWLPNTLLTCSFYCTKLDLLMLKEREREVGRRKRGERKGRKRKKRERKTRLIMLFYSTSITINIRTEKPCDCRLKIVPQ